MLWIWTLKAIVWVGQSDNQQIPFGHLLGVRHCSMHCRLYSKQSE